MPICVERTSARFPLLVRVVQIWLTSPGLICRAPNYPRTAKDYKASRYDLGLRDFEDILDWINEYKPNPNGKLYLRDNKLV